MANIVNYLEKIINGIKTNTFLQIGTLILIVMTLLWNILYSPDEREDQEMMVKEMIGLVEAERSFEKEYSALALSNEDYKNLQNDFRLFSCKIEQYKSLSEIIAVSDNCPANELLPQCDNQITSSCYDEIVFEDDELYFGEIVNDEPNGFGVYTDKYGQSYWGNFKNGEQYSYGYITDEIGRVIGRGEFKNDLQNGQGEEFYYEPNIYYKGQFLDGRAHGEGLTVASEYIYKGSFRKGVMHGQGVLFDTFGNEYIGMSKDGAFHGRGVYKDSQGVYKGDLEYGLFEGIGSMIYNSGAIYEGSWSRDKHHGFGKWTNVNGESYSGNYQYGKLNDKNAEITYANGTCKGGYVNDAYHGYVECFYKDGTYSKKNFHNGLLDGLSEWNDTDGMIYFRTYDKGLENGLAKDIYPDETIDEFNYVNGRVVGKLITTKNNILLSVCDYDDYVITNCDNKE